MEKHGFSSKWIFTQNMAQARFFYHGEPYLVAISIGGWHTSKYEDHLAIEKTRKINNCNPETLTSTWIPFGIGLVNLGMIFVFFFYVSI